MRVATIDIGTNTLLLLIAERRAGGFLTAVAERATITRLGEGVDRTRYLSAAAVSRAVRCLEDYAKLVHELDVERVSVVGTSAMRDAAGGEEIQRRVHALFGVDPQILTGEEEARLTFRGAVSGLPIEKATELAVFDIGGGSTEVVIGHIEEGSPQIAFSASYDVGSVRLTERFVAHDPPAETECDALLRAGRSAFAHVPALRLPSSIENAPIGVAGTMTTLAAVSLGMTPYDAARVHGHALPVLALRQVVTQLASMDLESRKRVPGMEPKRADVVVAGGLLALALLDHWQAAATRISDRGVRWGLAEELLS
jgi:exopolyphosphatase/guanosine-5'-triphosphate,3'-diphosphate pyrophosphatase